MKNLIFTFVLLFTVSFAFGQSSADNYKSDKDGWLVNLDEAYSLSKKTGKPIMANFTGSDWCGWCIRLKNEVFSKKEFIDWAAENVVLLELDFPRTKALPDELKQQNGSLQQFFGVSGYPTIWVFNMEFDASNNQFNIERLGKTGYIAGGAKNWTSETQKIIANKAN